MGSCLFKIVSDHFNGEGIRFCRNKCAFSAAAQTTIHVPADQPTIQAGINAAQNGDMVLVAPGTYNENIDFKGRASRLRAVPRPIRMRPRPLSMAQQTVLVEHPFDRLHPYINILFGRGEIDYGSGFQIPGTPIFDTDSSSNVLSPGVGLDLHLSDHFASKFDGQLQRYSTPVTASGHVCSKLGTVGVIYRFDFNHHPRYVERQAEHLAHVTTTPQTLSFGADVIYVARGGHGYGAECRSGACLVGGAKGEPCSMTFVG